MDENEWLFYKIYVPSEAHGDIFLEKILKPATEELWKNEKYIKWFFIRYLDDSGYHFRLRYLVRSNDIDSVCDFLENRFDEELSSLLDFEINRRKRILPIPSFDKGHVEQKSYYELSIYEQEIEKYGGENGLSLAEDIFMASSNLTVKAISGINSGEIDRYKLGLLTMNILMDECLEPKEFSSFLENYINYWTGSNYSSERKPYRDSLIEAGDKRKESTKRVLENHKMNQEVQNEINEFRNIVKLTIDFLQKNEKISQSLAHLCFHYIHMMNNRLGIWPGEEAYLAALLQPVMKEDSYSLK
jgi:thiopeptide-type bacteriocin biosynthesis protein